MGNLGLSRVKWASFRRATYILIVYITDIQKGMFYDPSELGIAPLSGSASFDSFLWQ